MPSSKKKLTELTEADRRRILALIESRMDEVAREYSWFTDIVESLHAKEFLSHEMNKLLDLKYKMERIDVDS